jgi:large subunit ribosomal protein L35Ae
LYSKGRVLGHKRAKRNSKPNTSLIQIEGVSNKEEAQFYLGKVRILDDAAFPIS